MPVESSPPLPCPTPCHLLPNCTSCLASKGADGGWQHCVWSSSLQQVMRVSCCPTLVSFLLPLACSSSPHLAHLPLLRSQLSPSLLSLSPVSFQLLFRAPRYCREGREGLVQTGWTRTLLVQGLKMCLVEVDVLDGHGWLGLNCLPHGLLLEGPGRIHLAQFSCPSSRQKHLSGLPQWKQVRSPSVVTSIKNCLIPTDICSARRAYPDGPGPNGSVTAHQATGNCDWFSHPLTFHPVD